MPHHSELKLPTMTTRVMQASLKNEVRDAAIQRLRDEGWTYRRLGTAFGLTVGGVRAVLWRRRHRPIPRENFDLSVRAINALRFGLVGRKSSDLPLKFSELSELSYRDVLDLPNVGHVTAREIASVLRRHGIVVRGCPPSFTDNEVR